ncbi:MAG TPA: hypothetical protein VFG07_08960 [Thermoplasmata archaeon]|nr:hypothetical protein [Thermoplasmata archaeon]
MTDDELSIALDQLRHRLDNQQSEFSNLQSKVGTTLGFVVTAMGLLFALGYPYLASHLLPAQVSATLLLLSAGILGASYMSVFKRDVPSSSWMLKQLNDPKSTAEDLKAGLVENYAGVLELNGRGQIARIIAINLAIALFIAGATLFVVEVLL